MPLQESGLHVDFGQVGCAFWRSAARAEAGSKPPQSAQGRPAGQDLLHTRLPAAFRHPIGSRQMKGIDAYGRSNPKAGGPLARLHRHTGTSTL